MDARRTHPSDMSPEFERSVFLFLLPSISVAEIQDGALGVGCLGRNAYLNCFEQCQNFMLPLVS